MSGVVVRDELGVFCQAGTVLWTYTTGGAIVSSPALLQANGTQFVIFASRDGCAYSLNVTEGALFWKYDTGAEGNADARKRCW